MKCVQFGVFTNFTLAAFVSIFVKIPKRPVFLQAVHLQFIDSFIHIVDLFFNVLISSSMEVVFFSLMVAVGFFFFDAGGTSMSFFSTCCSRFSSHSRYSSS